MVAGCNGVFSSVSEDPETHAKAPRGTVGEVLRRM
jgi:hypothetical protein